MRMTTDTDATPQRKARDRKARLAEELRANLQRRKAQTRSRRTGEADQRPEGIGHDTSDDALDEQS